MKEKTESFVLNLSLTKNKTTVCHTILLPCIEIKLDKHVELNIYTGKYCLRSNIKVPHI